MTLVVEVPSYAIEIEKFAHFFEVFATLNLAYGGSELFDSILETNGDKFFEYRKRSAKSRFTQVLSPILEFFRRNPNTATFQKNTGKWEKNRITDLNLDWETDSKVKNFNQLAQINAQYEKKMGIKSEQYRTDVNRIRTNFKPLFFGSGLFCIYVLLVLGYSQFYHSGKDSVYFVHICLMWMFILLPFLIFISLKGFFPRKLEKYNKFMRKRTFIPIGYDHSTSRISISFVFLLVIIFGISGFMNNHNDELHYASIMSARLNITVSVLIGILPCIAYILGMRVYDWRFNSSAQSLQQYFLDSVSDVESDLIAPVEGNS